MTSSREKENYILFGKTNNANENPWCGFMLYLKRIPLIYSLYY